MSTSADPRRIVRRELVLHAPPDDVWRALTAPERLAAWFGARVELDPRRGGAVKVDWPDGTARRGVVEVADRSQRLAFRWRPIPRSGEAVEVRAVSRVEFVLEAVDEGTRLIVVEEPGLVPGGWGARGASADARALASRGTLDVREEASA